MISIAGVLDAWLILDPPVTALDLPSAIGFFALALALVCARLDYGLGALLTSPSLGGLLTRWLWPAAVVAPMLLGSRDSEPGRGSLLRSPRLGAALDLQ